MRTNRVLVPDGWYWVSADTSNHEAVWLLREVLCAAHGVYEFEVRELCVEADHVPVYINAVDGFAAIRLNRGQPPQKPLRF
jgi:hypothetical protein